MRVSAYEVYVAMHLNTSFYASHFQTVDALGVTKAFTSSNLKRLTNQNQKTKIVLPDWLVRIEEDSL